MVHLLACFNSIRTLSFCDVPHIWSFSTRKLWELHFHTSDTTWGKDSHWRALDHLCQLIRLRAKNLLYSRQVTSRKGSLLLVATTSGHHDQSFTRNLWTNEKVQYQNIFWGRRRNLAMVYRRAAPWPWSSKTTLFEYSWTTGPLYLGWVRERIGQSKQGSLGWERCSARLDRRHQQHLYITNWASYCLENSSLHNLVGLVYNHNDDRWSRTVLYRLQLRCCSREWVCRIRCLTF